MPLLCKWSRMFVSLLVEIPSESECLCPTIGISCARIVVPPPPVSLKESGLSCFRGYDGCSGWNSVWMTNRAVIFAQSIQCSPSTVVVMMSSMNPSIDSSMAVMSIAKGSAVTRCLSDWCFSSCGSKDRCSKFRSSVSQDPSLSILLPRSIASSLTVVYSAVAGVIPKVNLSQRKAFSSTIAMHVGTVVAFACIRR